MLGWRRRSSDEREEPIEQLSLLRENNAIQVGPTPESNSISILSVFISKQAGTELGQAQLKLGLIELEFNFL